jgi:hypothetical protein
MANNDKFLYNNTPGQRTSEGLATKSIYNAVVVSDDGDQRLRVRIKGVDKDFQDPYLPVCYPLLPKFFHVTPRKGEVVRVFLSDTSKPHEGRLWAGPVLTQYDYLTGQETQSGDDVSVNEDMLYRMAQQEPIETSPDADDLYPNKSLGDYQDEVRLMSRGNVDILMQKNALVIRAGKHEKGKKKKKNRKNPALISINFSEDGEVSSVNLIGDMVNLVSHNGNPVMHDLKNGKITDKHHKDMEKSLHPVPYGDVLTEVLGLVIKVLCEDHKHPYNGQSPVKTPLMQKLLAIDLETLKSKGVRIN